jgi:hypothetical protein
MRILDTAKVDVVELAAEYPVEVGAAVRQGG